MLFRGRARSAAGAAHSILSWRFAALYTHGRGHGVPALSASRQAPHAELPEAARFHGNFLRK